MENIWAIVQSIRWREWAIVLTGNAYKFAKMLFRAIINLKEADPCKDNVSISLR